MAALVPGPGTGSPRSRRRRPGRAVAQPGQEGGVQAGLAGAAGGPAAAAARRARRLPGPGLGCRVNRVGFVKVAVQVGNALLDAGEPGVVAEVAAVVVADQDPAVAVQDPEAGDRRFVRFPAAPYQIRSAPPPVQASMVRTV